MRTLRESFEDSESLTFGLKYRILSMYVIIEECGHECLLSTGFIESSGGAGE